MFEIFSFYSIHMKSRKFQDGNDERHIKTKLVILTSHLFIFQQKWDLRISDKEIKKKSPILQITDFYTTQLREVKR